MLTEDQKSALQSVWAGISPDVPDEISPEEKAELLVEGNMLAIYGYPEIDKQITELRLKDNYETLKLIAKELGL